MPMTFFCNKFQLEGLPISVSISSSVENEILVEGEFGVPNEGSDDDNIKMVDWVVAMDAP